MSGYRPPYTVGEERKVLHYIVENKGYCQLRGRAFWISMEKELDIKRTWQSLKEHFQKYMYNKINNPLYQLSDDQVAQIKEGYQNSASGTVKKQVPQKPSKDLEDYVTSSDSD